MAHNENNYKKWRELVQTQYEEKQASRIEREFIEEIETLFKTTFIFPVAQLEDIMGDLWGIEKDNEEDLTEEEKKYDELFEEWRNSVLDNGNKQIRLFKRILIKYIIGANKVKFQSDNGNNNEKEKF